MKFFSTQAKAPLASLKEAIFHAIAPDGGLYLPVNFPKVPEYLLQLQGRIDYAVLYETLATLFFEEDFSRSTLRDIVKEAFNYSVPLANFKNFYGLELFHGPTLSFKDFGARFMAQMVKHMLAPKEKLLVLVATSGDTGSAVAQAFFNIPQVHVCILYASQKVSEIQEKQLTTIGANVTAFEVMGSFDDCQNLVKEAFKDALLNQKFLVTTANSINIARLIPQSFYFFSAYLQLPSKKEKIAISVPCGNFGHLMSGLIARKIGLPINHFIAATNSNDEVPRFIKTGIFEPKPSQATISNSMDVGNPSNFPRLWEFFHKELKPLQHEIDGVSFSDEQTKWAIAELYRKEGYVVDPHGAVSYLGLNQFLKSHPDWQGIFMATAHPAKFPKVIEELIHKKIQVPPSLKAIVKKTKQSVPISKDYSDFQKHLLSLNIL